MKIIDKLILGTILILGGIVGMNDIIAFWMLIIGMGGGLVIIGIFEKIFEK